MLKSLKFLKAQAAIEYLLLLGAVTVVALLAFKTLLPQHLNSEETFFNQTARVIMDETAEGKVRSSPTYWNSTSKKYP